MSSLKDRKRFEPSEVEPRIVERWLDSGLFHPEPEGTPDENFSIAIPPPNVTGALHMGHALNGSVQDTLIRFHRQRGRRAKWILGTDHAGIATQTQVEKRLKEQGTSREEIGRPAFIDRTWEWRDEFGGTIIEQFKRLGASLDYEEERFTLDERYVEAVLKVFVDLYDKGWIYRDNYMVNWDPGSGSAISDLEVEDREAHDTLFHVAYPLTDGSGEVVVATVRPETMLADVAVAVHPGDDRYAHLVGQTVTLPLVGRELPIIADEYVKTDFGTGCLKITPGHDPNDFEIGRRHGLPELSAIGEDGRMTDLVPAYAGLTVAKAQEAVVAALDAEQLIRARDPYTHTVPFSHRSGQRIEPLISLQWFMKMDELAAPAIQVVKDGKVRIHPESQSRRYVDWLENIRPWCISRQLWWGHQIPVWYRDGETYVGETAPEGDGWERDPDVLDTWFSSALWPFATLGWPNETPEYRAFYPTDVNSTARDIIFLWVARMVMMGVEFTGELPFRDVNIHSLIMAPDGRRMSKSLGTGIDPLDSIDAHGADATRFGLLAMSSSQDVKYNEEKIQQGQELANKLWNASRLILLGAGEAEAAPRPQTVEDRWILSRLERLTERVTAQIDRFELSRAALELYGAFWGEVCDWYLEFVKPRLRSEEPDEDTRATVLYVLERCLRLLHPMMPFVTEEIWSPLPGERGLLAADSWPVLDESLIDEEAEAVVGRTMDAVTALRRYRQDVGAPAAAWIPGRLAASGYEATAEQVARLARFRLADVNGDEPVATVTVPGGAVLVLATEAIDSGEAERRRAAERDKLNGEITRLEGKLSNQKFVDRAPAEVVEGERAKLARYQAELRELDS